MNIKANFIIVVLVMVSVVVDGFGQRKSFTLRILTYNIYHGETTDGRVDMDLFASIINEVKPDLVALTVVGGTPVLYNRTTLELNRPDADPVVVETSDPTAVELQQPATDGGEVYVATREGLAVTAGSKKLERPHAQVARRNQLGARHFAGRVDVAPHILPLEDTDSSTEADARLTAFWVTATRVSWTWPTAELSAPPMRPPSAS